MNKRGVSEIIGYILLVSTGLALSAMVYAWLLFFIPPLEKSECPDGLSLSIRNATCDSGRRELNFSVKNNGLFSIDGIVIKVNDKPSSNIGVFKVGEELTEIAPGEEFVPLPYDYSDLVSTTSLSSALTLLELQPMVKDVDGKFMYCKPMVKEVLQCS